jgi:predicted MFS family arabinose efflux permease
MSEELAFAETTGGPDEPAWAAIGSMTLGVFALVAAEFLPASLLTPMAADLRVTEGAAGQAVTATALVALISAVLVAAVTRRIDRRYLLIGFSALLIASNLLVAAAPSLPLLIAGRVLLGVGLGGFWAMAAALVMRLAPGALVARALSVLFSGVSAATIFAAPVGSYLGDWLGWRSVFLFAAGLGVVTIVAQFAALPRMAPAEATPLRMLGVVLRRPGIALGITAVMLTFTGHFAVFTYIRPFLETVTGVGNGSVSAILLGFGLANFIGTLLAGPLIERSLKLALFSMPLLMGMLGVSLIAIHGSMGAHAALFALWGLAFGAVPVAWSTWLTRTVPDQAETAGGLLVAAIQLAISIGAAGGGYAFDIAGGGGAVAAASTILLLTTVVVVLGVNAHRIATP